MTEERSFPEADSETHEIDNERRKELKRRIAKILEEIDKD